MQEDYKKALEHLRKGDVVLYPSDTIWGLGCDVRNEKAVEKIFQLKNRPENKAFIILISKIEQLSEYVVQVPEIAWNLVEFAEKPLTVIYPKGKNVASNLLGPDGTIAIRLLKDEFCKGLVYRFERAIVSTSANISGQPSPKIFTDIAPEITENVDYILQNPKGENKNAQASQIVKLGLGGDFEFIRK
ncbi:translation factor SUA5 [Pseudarcicella hirudinis]|uniref:L-threonylcarbamoyladenylate synthase n=1 Tax=Pseudarcicella hirudinis TaxID=1079859 RepID=A0A1I5PGU2_9BACT|nr:L-threonylcarbamoyladenylate synthase [Pseudarcicella hirudinis]SFP33328.1 translation factor SUA5 [Pseudarcicella hirudinis]